MQRRTLKNLGVETLETIDGVVSLTAKRFQDRFDGYTVVVCVVSLAIRHVGGVQSRIAGKVLVNSLGDETLEIEKMTGVLLHGPAAIDLGRQCCGWQTGEQILEARRRATDPLDHLRVNAGGKIKIEAAIGPLDSRHVE